MASEVQVDAVKVLGKLQNQIGQLGVDKAVAEVRIEELEERNAELEATVVRLQHPKPTVPEKVR